MHLFHRLDRVLDERNVLRHPFYRRWTAGTLTHEELAYYAGEYRHAVVALADQAAAAAQAAGPELRAELEGHAGEEAAHIGMWDEFGRALGADLTRAPRAETAEGTAAWTAGADLPERLAVLYAVESSQPAISQTKLDGLVEHYGFAHDGRGAAYFALHATRDHEHAAHSRALLAERLGEVDEDRLVELADAALAGNWRLLDGVEERAATIG